MPGRQDITLLCCCDMRIDFRDIDRTVPQHLLDIPYVYIRFQQRSGKGMPEHVRGDVLLYAGKSGVFVYHSPDRLVGKYAAILLDEEMAGVVDRLGIYFLIFL